MSDSSQGPGWWLASDGKWYPPQAGQPTQGYQQPPPPFYPPQGKPKRGHGCLYAILGAVAVVVVLIVVIAVAASSGSKKASNAISNVGGGNTTASYKVGDTAKTGPFNVTVYAVKDPQTPTNSFSAARTGDHYVSVDVQITNPGSNQQPFSSIIGFHLLDALNHQYDETVLAGLSPSAPDGQIAGGQSIRGFVVFEVPDGTTGLKLRVQGGITAAGAVFALS